MRNMTTRNASAHPWRDVVSHERHMITGWERHKQYSRLYIKLSCEHEIVRKGSTKLPDRVRCTQCPPNGDES